MKIYDRREQTSRQLETRPVLGEGGKALMLRLLRDFIYIDFPLYIFILGDVGVKNSRLFF
jgi:hypothetical protein